MHYNIGVRCVYNGHEIIYAAVIARASNIFTIIKMHYRMSSLQFHRLIDCMSREETKLLYLDHVAFWYSPVLVDQTAQVGSRGGDSVLKTERD